MVTVHATLHVFCLACDVAALIGCSYLLFATFVVRRWPLQARQAGCSAIPVTVLKPLHGDEPGLEHRLLSFERQRYEGALQIVFGCQDVADPAIAIARRVAAACPAHTTDVVVDGRLHGSNRKVSNLLHCFESARYDVIVLADSDIEVDEDYVAQIVEALAAPGVGAVTCLYAGEGITLGARFSAQAINAHFLPSVLAGMALGAATPCFGSTIALHRGTLERIGGFHAFVDKLADDYAIGEAVRRLGLGVAVLPFTVRHACAEPTFAAFVGHQLRFNRTIRVIDPLGHAGSLVTNPLPLALIAAIDATPLAWWIVAASLICRLALLRTVTQRFAMARQQVWIVPFCDLILFVVFLASFCSSTVEWRGHRYRSLSDGSLVPKKADTSA